MKGKYQNFFALVFLVLFFHSAKAQVIVDTVKNQSAHDTIILKKLAEFHSPRRAALFSTFLPGLGQVYNKKYWKLPILYAGAFGLIYSINFCNTTYIDYRTAYRIRLDNDPNTIDQYPKETDSRLEALTKSYHRFRDLSILGATLLYVLNIVDATVDAHLYTFDVSDDLSLNLQPAIIATTSINNQSIHITGLSIHLKF